MVFGGRGAARDSALAVRGAGLEGKTDPEVVAEQGKNGVHDRHISRVHNPTLTVYLPPRDKATGAAVVICPGGGHRSWRSTTRATTSPSTSTPSAWRGSCSSTAWRRTEGSNYKVEVHALADARRTMRLVRSHADEWGIDPKRVGMMGFSAGGELTALAGTKFEPASPGAADPIDRLDARPDFLMLVYPGGRPESFNITKETPPTFLLVADNDRLADRTIAIYSALKKAGVSAELHIYARGGHGFGMHDMHTPSRAGRRGSRTGWTIAGCSRNHRSAEV